MNVEVELPDLGDSPGDTATIAEWLCDEGDLVDQDQHLLEVVAGGETIEVPSPASGVLVEKIAEEGDEVRVGDLLAIIEARGEDEYSEDDDNGDE